MEDIHDITEEELNFFFPHSFCPTENMKQSLEKSQGIICINAISSIFLLIFKECCP